MILLASGTLLVELLLWNDEEMPSASPWRPEHAELGKRWPLYVIAFALFSTGIAAIEGFLLPRPILLGMFIVLLLGLTFLVRLAHRRRRLIPRDDFEDLGAPAVLKLG
jgi:hypothetical protein